MKRQTVTIRIERVGPHSLADLGALFGSERSIEGCWCMWFVVPVNEFHAGKSGANRERFVATMERDNVPMGLIAYVDGAAAGWCAAGPRERYRRALQIPTYRGGPKEDDTKIWLVPCLYVRAAFREASLGTQLLEAAVAMAREFGATAIEGMPFAGGVRRTGGDTQVGFEGLFRRCGFAVVRRPSATRVVMRREFA